MTKRLQILDFLTIMGKGREHIILFSMALVFLAVLNACQPENVEPGGSGGGGDDNTGVVTFNFPIPDRRVPVENVHRIDLSIAVDALSLYSGYFIESANVNDVQTTYSFSLEEGEYYYQAGITCSSQGDTCLWDGYPGGQWGSKWESGTIQIVKGETTVKNLAFNK